MTARWAVPAALGVALAVLGAAVQQGHLQTVDHYGFDHLQPLHKGDWSRLTDPVEPGMASLLMVVAALRLRGRRSLMAAWMIVFAASFAIELISKPLVEHPYPNPDLVPWLAHEGFPSGHTMRGIIVAGALAAGWPHARGVLAAWALANAALVALTGMHPLSEVAGGLVGGLALVACVWAAGSSTSRHGVADDVAGERPAARGRPGTATAIR